MNLRVVFYVLGWILIVFCWAMIPSVLVGLWYGTGGVRPLLISFALGVGAGCLMLTLRPKGDEPDIEARQGFLIVSLGWFGCSLFGALPFFLARTFYTAGEADTWGNRFRLLTDGVFESASGLTTTGASVLTDYMQPHAIMFWRSTMHWLGGMGIIVLSLAILPLIGAGGMQLFKAEVPGPVTDRLKPRIKDTAMVLSKVYLLLTIVQTLVLMACGMNLYEALCHTFGTVATGGFSTHPLSVGGYESPAVNYAIVFFMILAGTNFALHYRFLKGEWMVYFRNGELRAYLLLLLGTTVLITLLVGFNRAEPNWFDSVEHSLFQVVSIMTTTGFVTADFEQWPVLAQLLLFYLMFVGGCAGSTGGGIKVIRLVLLAKFTYREMYRLVYPSSVVLLKQDGKTVADRVMEGVMGFYVLTCFVFILSTGLMALYEIDIVTSLSATAACLFNVGPGLGNVGPYDNYAGLPLFLKWWLAFCMIIGRLELYSVMILTAPDFWRK